MTCRRLAALLLLAGGVADAALSFGAAGDGANAALPPQTDAPGLDAIVGSLDRGNGSFINPFVRDTAPSAALTTTSTTKPTPTPTPTPTAKSTPTPTPTTTPTNRPTSAPTPTTVATPQPPSTPTPVPSNSEAPTTPSSSSLAPTQTPSTLILETMTAAPEPSEDHVDHGSGAMEGHNRSGRRAVPSAQTPTPTPPPTPTSEEWEELTDTPTPSASKKRNVISFDVVVTVKPPSGEADDSPSTTRPSPSTSSPIASQPSTAPPAANPTPPGTAAPAQTTSAPGMTAAPPAPAPPSTPPAAPQTPPGPPGTVPTSPPPSPSAPAVSVKPGATQTPSSASRSQGTQVFEETANGGVVVAPATNSSSAFGGPVIGQKASSKNATKPEEASSSSSGSSTDSSNQSGSNRYSMGTASILSIVGVILGICIIISLFVLISRRRYDDDDDDRDVLGFGGGGGLKIDGRPSVVRLSPTFLMNGSGPGAPGQPMEPDFSVPSPQNIGSNHRGYGHTGSNRGYGPSGSSRGYAPTGAVAEESPAIMESSIPPRGRASSHQRGPSPSAFESSDDLSTLDSRQSDGWSSVMESEFDLRSASRCTRDTTFSNITMSQNFSEYNSSDLYSQGRGGSGRGTYRTTSRRTGGRGTRSAPMPDFDVDEDDSSSVLSYDVDEAQYGNARHGTQSGAYRVSTASSMSEFADYRSSNGSSRYSNGSRF